MNETFDVVYRILKWFSKLTGWTYHEINIIVYFILIPLIFAFFIDKILKKNYFKIGVAGFVFISLLFISDFEKFSTTLFNYSVDFLNWFEVIGLNFIQASVVICVIVPIIIIMVLMYINKKMKKNEG
ncbi:MAG: hypothetical protein KUG68_03950 [Flavobacteriaceae bacterium]|nr:hypothetical protein [Flavobacteriaceae bacterium]